ncbi:hypothetical protein DPMN_100964 [Dreissena polymorpha]|uniref:C-type lectin domain-containing protein n=1 Tax=Dreissena polymorpha TaxID=45954 RepID=A0A9D4LK73_DREPO|nr:hypothetical protein DPMN_100964 [Dreissena polymorpha]
MEYVKNELNTSFANVDELNSKLAENNMTIATLETNLRSALNMHERKLTIISDILISKYREDGTNCRLLGLSRPVMYEKSEYIVVNTSMNFQDATECCKQMSAHLPEVQDREENDFLWKSFGYIFLGGTDLEREGLWKWAHSGTSIPLRSQAGFQNWRDGEPNNVKGNENCLELSTSGYWNDLSCGVHMHRHMKVVCEL